MGAWSHEPFGNDSACDWAYELAESSDFSVVEAAYDQIILVKDEEYIDADIGSEVHAAVEALAQVLGQGTQTDADLEEVDEWLEKISTQPSPELINKALTALELLLAPNSELNELWQESDEYDQWADNLAQLKEVLTNAL